MVPDCRHVYSQATSLSSVRVPAIRGRTPFRARDLLADADDVLHDALVTPEVLALRVPQARLEPVGKRGGEDSTTQSRVTDRGFCGAEAPARPGGEDYWLRAGRNSRGGPRLDRLWNQRQYSPAVPLFEINGKRPTIHPDAYLAPTAVIVGDVRIAAGASVWFGAVLRGDTEHIEIGEGSNVQDNAVIHCAEGLPTIIGERVTVGHGAILEGCVVENGALVGMGSMMLQRTRLGEGALLAAGAVLTERSEVPAGQTAAGVPARVGGPVGGAAAKQWIGRPARHYMQHSAEYTKSLRRLSED